MPVARPNPPQFKARKWIGIASFSVGLLIPCFWQSRIQSADLSSHIYNAWLVTQIKQGTAPGLWLSSQSNNVLFDLMLGWFLVRVGPDLAQRFAVSICVLVFGWGAIRFIFRIAGRNWWFAAPCVAMLAYGFVFHMGFFNFYLSLGLCLWYLATVWETSWQVHTLAAPLLALAWIAHPFPVVWAIGMTAYVAVANAIQPQRRLLLLLLGLAVLLTVRSILIHRYACSWSVNQVSFAAGANQIVLFGWKYAFPFAGLLLVWVILLFRLVVSEGTMRLVSAIPFQLWLLNAAAVFLIPDRISFPQFGLPLGYIAQRLSFCAGLMMCAVLTAAPASRLLRMTLPAVAIVFFSLLYTDDLKLNRMEDQLDVAVRQLPPGERVVSVLASQSLLSLCSQHDLDRACIGHCFSYANYEPSSRQFRVRARPGNGIVLADYGDVDAVASGRYVVRSSDIPIYLVYPCRRDARSSDSSDICTRPLQLGETSGNPN
jgi:hypothetical protein